MTKKNETFITQAELSRRLGVSRAAVNKAIKSGRITASKDGLFDPVKTIEDWRSNTRVVANDESVSTKESKRVRGGQAKYTSARARRELANARIAELKEERLRGLYVRKDEMESALESCFLDFRRTLEQMPNRISHHLANKNITVVRELLNKEIDSAIYQLYEHCAKELEELAKPDESEYPSTR